MKRLPFPVMAIATALTVIACSALNAGGAGLVFRAGPAPAQ